MADDRQKNSAETPGDAVGALRQLMYRAWRSNDPVPIEQEAIKLAQPLDAEALAGARGPSQQGVIDSAIDFRLDALAASLMPRVFPLPQRMQDALAWKMPATVAAFIAQADAPALLEFAHGVRAGRIMQHYIDSSPMPEESECWQTLKDRLQARQEEAQQAVAGGARATGMQIRHRAPEAWKEL